MILIPYWRSITRHKDGLCASVFWEFLSSHSDWGRLKIEDYLIWGRRIDQHSCTASVQTRDWKLSIVAEQVTEAQKPLCKWPCSQLLATCIALAQQEVVSSVCSVWCSLHISVVVYSPLWYTQLTCLRWRNYAWLHLNSLLKLHADITFFLQFQLKTENHFVGTVFLFHVKSRSTS